MRTHLADRLKPWGLFSDWLRNRLYGRNRFAWRGRLGRYCRQSSTRGNYGGRRSRREDERRPVTQNTCFRLRICPTRLVQSDRSIRRVGVPGKQARKPSSPPRLGGLAADHHD